MITVGSLLKKSRIKQNLKIDDVAKTTLIKNKFIKAVETGNWKIFPSKVYAQGVVRNYAKTLGEDLDKVMAYFRSEYNNFEKLEFREKKINENPIAKVVNRLNLSLIILSLIFLAFLSFQIFLFLKPPKLMINLPDQETIVVKKNFIQISGKTEKDAQIKINDQDLEINQQGEFHLRYPLLEEKNTVKITVIGANGRSIEKNYTVIKEN